MSAPRKNVVIWTIVISFVTIIVTSRFVGPTSMPEWTDGVASTAIGIVVIVMMVMIGRAGVRAALSNRVTPRTLIVFTLIGMGCAQVAEAIPVLGLGGLFSVYGLPGLIALGLRKLSQRAKNPPADQK